MAVKWTKEQEQVIKLRNRNILVSAAAGSGKTAVLVQRILEKVMDPDHPVDIDRLLIMTFTRAAAGEMRERIANALENAINACKLVQTARTSINNSYSSISDTASDYGEVNSNRIITVKVFDKNNKLCINITNTYAVEPVFVNNTPVSDKAGHGIGIRSIISVIEKYNGVYDFFTEDGLFYFQACI